MNQAQNACCDTKQAGTTAAVLDALIEGVMAQVERGDSLQTVLVTLLEETKPTKGTSDPKSAGYPSTVEGVLQCVFGRLAARNDAANELIGRVERQIGHFKLLP